MGQSAGLDSGADDRGASPAVPEAPTAAVISEALTVLATSAGATMAAVLAEMSIACRGGCCGPDCEHDAGRGKHLDMMAIPLVKGILGKAYAHLADLATRMHAMAELRLGIEADDPYVFLHSGLGLADAVEVVKTAFLAGAVSYRDQVQEPEQPRQVRVVSPLVAEC